MKQADLYIASVKAEKLYELAARRTVLADALIESEKSTNPWNAATCLAPAVGINGETDFSLPALQQLAYSRILDIDAELKAEGVELESPQVYPPGVVYSARPGKIHLNEHAAKPLRVSLGLVKAQSGTWTLTKEGGIELVGAEVQTLSPLVAASDPKEGSSQRLNALESSVSDIASVLKGILYKDEFTEDMLKKPVCEGSTASGYEFNKAEDLPPVGCNLLIKVPAGTHVFYVKTEKVDLSYTVEKETVFSAFRTKHLSDRNGQMEYRLSDDSLVTGRFEWTYP